MATSRPSRVDLGLNPLALGCLISQAAVLLFTIALYQIHGLSLVFDQQTIVRASVAAIGLVIWVSFLIVPGRRSGWPTAEAAFAFLLINIIISIVAPAQYGAFAVGRPFIDQVLARADSSLGLDALSLLRWTEQHPRILSLLLSAYDTLSWQILLAVPVLRLLRERQALWEFVFHFHFCLIVALLACVLWPVAGAYQWFDYTTPIDLSRVVAQVNGFHDGSLTVVRWAELDGLISMPSFHTATGLFATWAVRRRWLGAPMFVLNGLLILATFLAGIHYFVDVLAGAFLFASSLMAYAALKNRMMLVPVEGWHRAGRQTGQLSVRDHTAAVPRM